MCRKKIAAGNGGAKGSFVRYLRDRGGNFAIITAVMVPALLAAVGMSVDYANASLARSQMQNAADAAILAVTQEGRHLKDEDAYSIVSRFLARNGSDAYRLDSIERDGSDWKIDVAMDYVPAFAGILGVDTIPLSVNATASFSSMRFEIALVLDTTGSMAGKKLADMKQAAVDLVAGMTGNEAEGEDDGLRFSVVPFAHFVNVGPQYAPTINTSNGAISGGADWLDLFGRTPITQRELPENLSRFSLYHNMSRAWPGCVETRVPDGVRYDVEDIEPNPGQPRSLFVPSFYNSEPNYSLWHEILYGRPNTYGTASGLARYGVPNASNLNPSTFRKVNIGSGSLGPDRGCDTKPLIRLTNKFTEVRNRIDELDAAGNTNIHEGVMWGWRTLSHRRPFADGAPPSDETVRKIMIVLTDGANIPTSVRSGTTWGSAYSALGFSADARFLSASANARQYTSKLDDMTLQGCVNAKKAGIEIYTILLEVDDRATSTLLENCATTKEHHHFDAPSSSQLRGVFNNIKNRIQGVLLTG